MAVKMGLSSTLPLPNSSVVIPRLGFGVYLSPPDVTTKSCLTALKVGYKHVDSAQYYRNEKQVGDAVIQSGQDRKSLFLTTKIMTSKGSPEETYKSVVESADMMGGYTDLFLIHTSSGGKEERKLKWLALEKLLKHGKTRSIGVSNWNEHHIAEMKEYAQVWPPHVLQIELHPWCQQRKVVEYCKANGIVVEAYAPLVRGQKMDDPTLQSIAKKHNKGPDHVLVRWALQNDLVPLPKSDTPSRIESNADLYDFELTSEDMKALDGLDQGSKGAIVQAVDDLKW